MLLGRQGRRGYGQGKPAARPHRPALEQLESRLAPAVYHVNTFQDTPQLNNTTDQDASGHVSLRSAVAAANSTPQDDTIVLGAGVYQAQTGELEVHGNLRIIGQGAGQTVIETRHLDRLFEVVGGDLELSGLTLDGGSASTLLKGAVHLTSCQITDTDFTAVALALVAPRVETPISPLLTSIPPLSPHAVPELLQTPAAPDNFVRRSGGGASWAASVRLQETQETHQTFWRVDAEAPAEQPVQEKPAQEKPEDMKQSRARDQRLIVAWSAIESDTRNTSTEEIAVVAVQERADTQLPASADGGIASIERGPCQATILLLVAGCYSFQMMTKDMRNSRSWESNRRRRSEGRRRHNPTREGRHTRGPPGTKTRISISKKADSDVCLVRFLGGDKLRVSEIT
jgi:hypothetical protein